MVLTEDPITTNAYKGSECLHDGCLCIDEEEEEEGEQQQQ